MRLLYRKNFLSLNIITKIIRRINQSRFVCFLVFCLGLGFAHSSLSADANFTVSGGGFSAPFLLLLMGTGKLPTFPHSPFTVGRYQFSDSGISGSHPFMIGESYGDTSSSLLTVSSMVRVVPLPLRYHPISMVVCIIFARTIRHDSGIYHCRANHVADLNSTVSLEMIWVEPGTFTWVVRLRKQVGKLMRRSIM